jgi:hypothetical protein
MIFMNFAIAADESVTKAQNKIIHSYMAAFNMHDAESMLKMVTDDVQWLSIDGEKITKETNNKKELRSSMVSYFKSCDSCKSRIIRMFSTGSRVSVLEMASFETSNGMQEQQSLSVYEFKGALIKRVYYFPAENFPVDK